MTGLNRGLYEQLITEGLEEALSALDAKHRAQRAELHPEEGPIASPSTWPPSSAAA
ncbi:MAG TPA: hypothetical protein VIG97_08980 [Luteimonas sp.]